MGMAGRPSDKRCGKQIDESIICPNTTGYIHILVETREDTYIF